jgi:hypothetical protein
MIKADLKGNLMLGFQSFVSIFYPGGRFACHACFSLSVFQLPFSGSDLHGVLATCLRHLPWASLCM